MSEKNLSYVQSRNRVRLTRDQRWIELGVITPDIIHFFQPHKDERRISRAVEYVPESDIPIQIAEQPDGIFLDTGRLRVKISEDFRIDVFDQTNSPVCLDYRGGHHPPDRCRDAAVWGAVAAAEGHEESEDVPPMAVSVMKVLEEGTHFYGLGEKTGPLDKRGYFYRMWNTDNPQPHTENFETLYKSIPFLIVQKGPLAYGLFLDNSYESYFDMGKENSSYFYFGAKDGNLDYYLIYGPSIKEVVAGYTLLTGRTPLPQLWTLGYQQCRWSYAPKERLMDVASTFRKEKIPCDVLYLDIDYMDGYRVFTYDKERFAGFPEMLRQLRSQGFKVVAIVDPGVKKDAGYSVFEEGLQNGYFVTDPDGVPYVNRVWPGDALYPDYSNARVRKWWGERQKFLTDNGVAGIWNDMNEPASFNGPLPDNLRFDNDGYITDHREMHNVYGHYMARASFEGLRQYSDTRPFVITRACFAGTQKYSTVWTGDNQSLWEHLRMSLPQLMNLGLSGFAFAGCDVGGFGFDCTPELLCRWVQVGCFTPLFRNHSSFGTRRQEPWAFDEQTKAINKKYIELRYTLLPYMYDLLRESEKSGLPVMRPLVMEFQNDSAVSDMNDEFLLGGSMLIAPVVQQGQRARAVYLPEGADWIDFWTNEYYKGGRYVVREAPLDLCPIYVRKGSVIPRWPVQQYVGEQKIPVLTLDIYLPECGKTACYQHYLDDGETYAYRHGAFNCYDITAEEQADRSLTLCVTKSHSGYGAGYPKICLRLHNPRTAKALVNGKPVTVENGGMIEIEGGPTISADLKI